MFTAANISVGALSFNPPETASITAEQVARLGNIIRNTSMVPRLIDVGNGTNVFLVGGSFNPNPNVTAWGFITALASRTEAHLFLRPWSQSMAFLMAQHFLMELTMQYCRRARTPMQSRIRRFLRKQGASLSLTVKPHLWKPAFE
jgi:hypothetical protein